MAGRTITGSLSGLWKPRRGTLKINQKKKPQGSLAAKAGIGSPKAKVSGGRSGTLDISTLTEKSRSLYPETTIYSSDGILSFVYKPIKEATYDLPDKTTMKFVFIDPATIDEEE
jgi:hypothetical protein